MNRVFTVRLYIYMCMFKGFVQMTCLLTIPTWVNKQQTISFISVKQTKLKYKTLLKKQRTINLNNYVLYSICLRFKETLNQISLVGLCVIAVLTTRRLILCKKLLNITLDTIKINILTFIYYIFWQELYKQKFRKRFYLVW